MLYYYNVYFWRWKRQLLTQILKKVNLLTDVVGNHHHKANEPMWLPDA